MGSMKIFGARSKRGSIAEFGPALFAMFCVVIFPMIAFGSIGMRYMVLNNAANLAAQSASRQKTFLVDTNANANNGVIQLSAVHTAQNVATFICSNMGGTVKGTSGVVLNSTNVYIKIAPIGTQSAITQPAANTPLPSAGNTSNYTYTCEVVLNGTLQPLLGGLNLFGKSIPLLNAPLTTKSKADYYFESTQLNI